MVRDNVPHRGKFEDQDREELAVEQNWLVSSGKLQLLLGEALSRLPNLVELTIRDYNVPNNSCRPGSREVVVSYGTRRVLSYTGVDFVAHESHLISQGTQDTPYPLPLSLILEYKPLAPDKCV